MRRVSDLMRLEGRVALLTGGAGKLGEAFGQALAEAGARIVVADRDEAGSAARAEALAEHGGAQAHGIGADLSDPAAPAQLVRSTLELFGRLDIVINNAAVTGQQLTEGYAVPFAHQTLDAWREAISVNLTAAFALSQAASQPLADSGNGSIINVGSIYGLVGPNLSLYAETEMGNPAAYAASKGGLLQLTRYLSTVLAPRVRVNAITPGGILRNQPKSFQDRYEKLTPLARMGVEEDFKGVIAFLASDASAYVTGQNFVVDGGWTAW